MEVSSTPRFSETDLILNGLTIVNALTKSQIRIDDETPKANFYVCFGKRLGVPRCRGCKRDLRDRNELRIVVSAVYVPPHSGKGSGNVGIIGKGPYPNPVNFCFKRECLETALSEPPKKRDLRIDYPEFNSKRFWREKRG